MPKININSAKLSKIEQNHIANALVFELSKVEKIVIRERMVSHLLNIDKGLASHVFDGLRLKSMPKPLSPAEPVNHRLKISKALSITYDASCRPRHPASYDIWRIRFEKIMINML